MYKQHSSKAEAHPGWYAELASPPFRGFDETFANRLLSRVHDRSQDANLARLKRIQRMTLGVIAASGIVFAVFVLASIWEGRGSPVQLPNASPAAQTEGWVTHDQAGVRFDLPGDWTVTPLPSQQYPEEAMQNAEEQMKLLLYKSQLLQLMKESTPYEGTHNSAAGSQAINPNEVEIKKLELQIAELERKLAEYRSGPAEDRQPLLAFASPDGPDTLGTLRALDNYGLISSQSLDTKFPAGATLLEPVHPLTSLDVKGSGDGGTRISAEEVGQISVARLRYPPSNGQPGIVAAHYYVMFGTITYEIAFFGSTVPEEVRERIALSLVEAQ